MPCSYTTGFFYREAITLLVYLEIFFANSFEGAQHFSEEIDYDNAATAELRARNRIPRTQRTNVVERARAEEPVPWKECY